MLHHPDPYALYLGGALTITGPNGLHETLKPQVVQMRRDVVFPLTMDRRDAL